MYNQDFTRIILIIILIILVQFCLFVYKRDYARTILIMHVRSLLCTYHLDYACIIVIMHVSTGLYIYYRNYACMTVIVHVYSWLCMYNQVIVPLLDSRRACSGLQARRHHIDNQSNNYYNQSNNYIFRSNTRGRQGPPEERGRVSDGVTERHGKKKKKERGERIWKQ